MKANKKESRAGRGVHRRDPAGNKGKPARTHARRENQVLYAAGRNSVLEALRAGLVKKVVIKHGGDKRLQQLKEEAQKRQVPVVEKDEEYIDSLAPDVVNQGVAAQLKPYTYADLDSVLDAAQDKQPILVLLDGVEDVRNLGAIVRTAECAGVTAVLLPEHRSSPVTPAALKTAAGAFATMPVCQIGNIRQTLEKLKEKGFWVVGADMDGENLYYEANLKGPLVIVMGAEGKGVSRLTKETCDFMVRIPMKGKISSLNVSVAAALLIYEAVRQRG